MAKMFPASKPYHKSAVHLKGTAQSLKKRKEKPAKLRS
jgi:hypothetical protein